MHIEGFLEVLCHQKCDVVPWFPPSAKKDSRSKAIVFYVCCAFEYVVDVKLEKVDQDEKVDTS